ncbi:hypothetical protein GQ42DRAFT_88745 [Ramicandelaber brevisporus]|nr:hypothetical protein GQ42DRAFT_88745 [Ramicandelaber brevisporus]
MECSQPPDRAPSGQLEHFELGLLNLPSELLEEISLYFETGQAAKVLTAHSILHRVFTRKIWRKLDPQHHGGGKRIPMSAWERYGTLVREVKLMPSRPVEIPVLCIPNLMRLEVDIECLTNPVFNKQIGECRNLQYVKLTALACKFVHQNSVEVVNEWISAASQRGQSLQFEWDLERISGLNLTELGKIVNGLKDVDHHSLKALFVESGDFPTSAISKLAQMMDSLHIWTRSTSLSVLADLNSEGIIYPHLRNMSITIAIHGRTSAYDFNNMSPERFPALECLSIDGVYDYSESLFLYTHTWTSVSKLVLRYFHDKRLSLGQIAQHFPNIDNLDLCSYQAPISINALATTLPRLQRLELYSADYFVIEPATTARVPLSNLLHLTLDGLFNRDTGVLKRHQVEFILKRVPNLQSLTIGYYTLVRSILKSFYGQFNLSLQTVVFEYGELCPNMVNICTFMALFPKVKRVGIVSDLALYLHEWRKALPNVAVYHIKRPRE